MYEEAFFHLLGALHAHYGLNSLALAGGCAMNSVANGKVRRQSPFKRVYIQPAPGDAGGAFGAANQVWHTLAGNGPRPEAFRTLTGVPMVLNTSFNENEPVVCKPEEAPDLFPEDEDGYACVEDHADRDARLL
jgi:predicted NodU family carbamoyl transferase